MPDLRTALRSPANLARLILGTLIVIEIAILTLGPDLGAALKKAHAFAATPKETPWEADVDIGIHLAAGINLVLLLILALTAKWWTRRFSKLEIRNQKSEIPRWFWPSVLAVIALSTALRLPLASKSLWWDECWVIRQCSHGSWKPDKKNPDELTFSPTTWKRCAFYYQKPTNHVPMSLMQKLTLGAWRKTTGTEKHEFSDLAARIPALLASAAAIALIAYLFAAWGRPGVGIIAAILLALHPWHIRYGVDARAYALVVPLCLSALLAATRILECGGRRWQHWLWLGANQFLWLWAYPNALLDIAAIFIVLSVLLWREHPDKTERHTALSRLAICHVFAAMLLLQMFLPNFLQARRWAGTEPDKHVLDARLAGEALDQLAFGVLERAPDELAKATSVLQQFQASATSCGDAFVLLGLGGVLLLGMRNRSAGLLLACIVMSTFTFAAITWAAQSYYYPRFSMAMLPVFVIGLAMLPGLWGANARKNDWFAKVALVFAIVLPLTLIAVAQPARHVLLMHPISPLRDVADFLRSHSSDAAPPVVLGYGFGRETLPTYYPQSIGVTTAAEIETHIAKARAEKRDLYLVLGYSGFNRAMVTDGFRVIDNKEIFAEAVAFPGIEPDFYFRVFKALPRP